MAVLSVKLLARQMLLSGLVGSPPISLDETEDDEKALVDADDENKNDEELEDDLVNDELREDVEEKVREEKLDDRDDKDGTEDIPGNEEDDRRFELDEEEDNKDEDRDEDKGKDDDERIDDKELEEGATELVATRKKRHCWFLPPVSVHCRISPPLAVLQSQTSIAKPLWREMIL